MKRQVRVKTQAIVAFRPIGARRVRANRQWFPTLGDGMKSTIATRTFPSAKEADAFVQRNRKGWDFHSVRVQHTLIGRFK